MEGVHMNSGVNREVTQIVPLANSSLVSPYEVNINGSDYELVSGVTDKVLNRELGAVGKLFSKQLYNQSSELWSQLVKFNYESTKEFRQTHNAIVQDGKVLAVSQVSSFEDFYSGVDKLAESIEGSEVYTFYNGSYLLEAFVTVGDTLGIHVEYFLDEDRARVTSYLRFEDSKQVYVNPVPIIDNVVEVSFLELLDANLMKQYLEVDKIIKYSYKDFNDKLKDTFLSVGELIGRLKVDLGIKYYPEIDTYDLVAEDERFDEISTKMLASILNRLSEYSRVAQYGAQLKKDVTFMIPSMEYYNLISYLAYRNPEFVSYSNLADFNSRVLSSKLNYDQLELVNKEDM